MTEEKVTEEKLVCFTADELLKPREIVIEIMEFMVKAGLTDYTGGNMSLRVGKKIYSTQTRASVDFRWRIRPDDIIVTDVEQNVLEGRREKLSSEADLHHGILKRFPDINCTLHGNTHYSPLIISGGLKAEIITVAAREFGIKSIAVVPKEYPMFSEEEKNFIYDAFMAMHKKGEALVAIMQDHGTFVAGENHNKAFVLFNAMEANSKYIYDREILRTGSLLGSILEKAKSNITRSGSRSEAGGDIDSYNDSNRVFKKDNVITAQDIENLGKQSSSKKVILKKGSIITSMAEARARELGITLLEE